MAFGFSPKHVREYKLHNLNSDTFLVFAIEAASNLGWDVSFINESGFIAYTKISWKSWSEEVSVRLDSGVAIIKSETTGSQIVDWGKNKRNVENLLQGIEDAEKEMTQDTLANRLLELRQNYSTTGIDLLNKPPSSVKDKLDGFLSIFKPVRGYFISPALIDLNILVFIIMLIAGVHVLIPENQDLLNWGANFRPVTLEGQWWRLITACFIHVGIFHLLLNMYALLYIGILLEPYLGKVRFLAAYLLSGFFASMTSMWWNPLIISAGASGAIFGMYGVFLALLTTNLLDKSVKRAFLTSIAVFVGYNILNGIKPNSGIDNAAHLGGLLSGLIIGYAYVPSLKQFENKSLKFGTIIGLTIIVVASFLIVYNTLPNDIKKYEEKMKEFATMEKLALEVYQMSPNTPNEKILAEIKNRGLYYWNENIKLLESIDDLDLPSQIKLKNSKLIDYCRLRISSYELIYRAVEEDTDKYNSEISECNKKLEIILDELSKMQ